MYKINSLLIILALVACGTDDHKPNAATETAKVVAAKPDAKPSTNETALYVDAAPDCTADNDGQLVYVKTEAAFMACSAGKWAAVDIKGAKGERGAAGADGKAGEDGTDGAKGDTGIQGDDGQALAPNTWLDPISGRTWLVAGGAYAPGSCTNGWQDPTYTELGAASSHGLWAGLGSFVNFGSLYQCGVHMSAGYFPRSIDPATDCTARNGQLLGVYCLKTQ